MGGSGGGSFLGDANPADLARRIRTAEAQLEDQRFQASVERELAGCLASYNDRSTAPFRRLFDRLKASLKDVTQGTEEILFGGSVAKHTYIDGLSDVDALVVLGDHELAKAPPSRVRALLAAELTDLYGPEAVREGDLAVTVALDAYEVQLVPAMRHGQGLRIGTGKGDSWSSIKPRRFADRLTSENKRLNGKLVPCVKLVKAMVAKLPKDLRLTGYHTEALALEVFRGYKGPGTNREMLSHFFESVGAHIRTRIRDPSEQSRYVDDYLGNAGSHRRGLVVDALERLRKRIRNANGARSLARWRELLG